MNNKYWLLSNMERGLNSTPEESIYNIYRILKVKEFLNGEIACDPYHLMDVLRQVNVEYFKGNEKIFYEIYKIICDLSEREIFEYACNIMDSEKTGMGAMIPETLAKLMFKDVLKAETVLVTDAEKFGFALYDLIKLNRHIHFSLTVKNRKLADLYSVIFSDCGVIFEDADIYEDGFTVKKFDFILAFPLMGVRNLEVRGDFISREPSFIAVQNLLYHLTLNGKLSIILPAKIGFAGGDADVLRHYIEDYYKVNEIASLPSRVFYPYMAINTYLLTISNGETDAVNMIKYKMEKENLVPEDDRLLFQDELAALNNWNVDMAFSIMDDTIMEYKNSTVKKSILKDVADVFRGKAISTKSENGNVAVVNISNISDTGINYASLDTIEEEERKVSRYLLQDGDVLIATKGFAVKVAVFKGQKGMVIASSNLCVIRPKGKLLNGTYLKLFLESETGMKLIKALQRGTTIVNINYQDICELEIPTPLIDEQIEIANEYLEGLEMYTKVIKEAENAWSKIKHNVMKKLF